MLHAETPPRQREMPREAPGRARHHIRPRRRQSSRYPNAKAKPHLRAPLHTGSNQGNPTTDPARGQHAREHVVPAHVDRAGVVDALPGLRVQSLGVHARDPPEPGLLGEGPRVPPGEVVGAGRRCAVPAEARLGSVFARSDPNNTKKSIISTTKKNKRPLTRLTAHRTA